MNAKSVKVDIRPDWLTVTGRYEDAISRPISEPADSGSAWAALSRVIQGVGQALYISLDGFREVNAPPYYRYAFHDKDAGVLVAFGGGKQGYMVQLQGRWWATHPKIKVYMKEDIRTQGLKPTRFDWSVTISRDSMFDYMSAIWTFDYARIVRDTMGKQLPRLGLPTPKGGLDTTVAGSRESAKYVRMYDKVYWAEDVLPALRLEIEYKKGAVQAAWRDWTFDNERLTADMLNYCFQDPAHWPTGLSELFAARRDSIPSTVPKDPSDREKWFNGVVRKSFVYWAQEDPVGARIWLYNALAEWTDLYTLPDDYWRDNVERQE